MRLTMRHPVLLALVLFAASAAMAQVPGIDALQSTRVGDDLVINWTPPASPVDGYRVYLSRDVYCLAPQLLYDGPAASFTHTGAFLDPKDALYQVAAYIAAQEGPRTRPVYRYRVNFPEPLPPPSSNSFWYSIPLHTNMMTALDLCEIFNGISNPPPIMIVSRSVPEWDQDWKFLCRKAQSPFDIVPGEAYAAVTQDQGSATLYGDGHPSWDVDLTVPAPPGPLYGNYVLSLPYDHAYDDLRQIADEIPGAIAVKSFGPDFEKQDGEQFHGLERASSADPWTGVSLPIPARPPEPILVRVDTVPVRWSPRRICADASCPVPLGRVSSLTAVKQGDDVELRWSPGLRAGSYDLYREVQKDKIPLVLGTTPLLTVAGATPTLPVVDPGAVTGQAPLLYYQMVARCPTGEPGDL